MRFNRANATLSDSPYKVDGGLPKEKLGAEVKRFKWKELTQEHLLTMLPFPQVSVEEPTIEGKDDKWYYIRSNLWIN